jgi:hypothetical protein
VVSAWVLVVVRLGVAVLRARASLSVAVGVSERERPGAETVCEKLLFVVLVNVGCAVLVPVTVRVALSSCVAVVEIAKDGVPVPGNRVCVIAALDVGVAPCVRVAATRTEIVFETGDVRVLVRVTVRTCDEVRVAVSDVSRDVDSVEVQVGVALSPSDTVDDGTSETVPFLVVDCD